MGKINVLSFEIANLIAAGEVVERPSSVLKELIENSVDAGATHIVAEIKRGGVALIRVTDDGCGIDKEDLPVALKRHATSKIRERDDLDSIITLGFRGEALAAISSVSEVTIITKPKEAQTGYMLTSEGGRIIDVSEVGASDGTTVVVENLFYNVPARRKFLKKDSTEAMNVTALVEKIALSRPDISIQLLIDGEEKFKTPGDGELLSTVRAVFGKDFASKLIYANGESDGIKVSGYIGRSDNVRKNRNLENIFINGRYVKSLTAQAALEKAYSSFIAPECFPTCALFLEMNPGLIDVNVHPAKLEVKFSDERRVFEAVYYTVKRALEESEYRPQMQLGSSKSSKNALGAFVAVGQDTKGEQISVNPALKQEKSADFNFVKNATPSYSEGGYKNTYASSNSYAKQQIDIDKPLSVASGSKDYFDQKRGYNGGYAGGGEAISVSKSVEILKKYSEAKPQDEEAPKACVEEIPEYKYVGEAFDCYVFIEYDGDLLVIDKHAAHERIIFEQLNDRRKKDGRIASQTLLLPITVMLTPDEYSAVADCADEFKSVGYDFYLNEKAADIIAIPDAITASDAEGLFLQMADDIIRGKGNPANTEDIRRERLLYQIACKAAIKGGRNYDKAIIDWLIAQVLKLPDITVCPHGRPIAYKLTKRELDKQFDRIK